MEILPNTLSIYVNTRIRGNSKIKYSPGMSVKGDRSEQVFFNPVIKLDSSVVNTIPSGLPQSEKMTQFFSQSQFNSLIQRTLGQGLQPRRTLRDAKITGVINNNIRITLDTLFRSGNAFYLDGRRYTIYSYEWEGGDWKVESLASGKMKRALDSYTTKISRNAFYPSGYIQGRPGYPQGYPQGYPGRPGYLQGYPVNQAYPTTMDYPQTGYTPMGYKGHPGSGYSGYGNYPSPFSIPITYAEPINIDKEDLHGNIDPNLSKLERAAINSGVGSVLSPKTQDKVPAPEKKEKENAKDKKTPARPKSAPSANSNTIIPEPKTQLSREFLSYFQEGVKKGFISTSMTKEYMETINSWTIKPNSARGDCFFESLRDILNGYNASSRTPIIVAPYCDNNNKYSVSSLRSALVDYVRDHPDFSKEWYDNLTNEIIAIKPSKKGTRISSEYRYATDKNNEILPLNEILANMRLSATPKERMKGEKVFASGQDYFWGDFMTMQIFESIFLIKIVCIDTQGITKLGNGQQVEYVDKTSGTKKVGTINRDNFGLYIENDDYEIARPPTNEITEKNRYSIYCLNSFDNIPRNLTRFAFILWSGSNHFEALYQKLPRGDKYIYSAVEIPSYIKYMIFENCYKIIPEHLNPEETSYGQIDVLSPYLRGIMSIYNSKRENGAKSLQYSNKRLINGGDASSESAGDEATGESAGDEATGEELGEEAQIQPVSNPPEKEENEEKEEKPLNSRPVTSSIRYSYGYNPNLTYYIIIDLELYPGDHIPLETKASLACQIRYEKIRQSYAEMFGLVYQPNELLVPEEHYNKSLSTNSKNKTKKSDDNSRKNITRKRW